MYKVQYFDGDKETLEFVSRKGNLEIVYPNQDRFVGFYNEKKKKHGSGAYYWARPGATDDNEGKDAEDNVQWFKGQYVNGRKCGFGTMRYFDGSSYAGLWKDDKRHGAGTLTFVNGDCYSGNWVKGKKHGHGAYRYEKCGTQLVGEWKNGSFLRGKWVSPNVDSYHGTFRDNIPVGVGVHFHECGLQQQGVYEEKGDDQEDTETGAPAVQFRGGKLTDALDNLRNVLKIGVDALPDGHAVSLRGRSGAVGGTATLIAPDDKPKTDSLIEELYNDLDKNGDGKIDLEEMADYLNQSGQEGHFYGLVAKVPNLMNREIHGLVKRIDRNKDTWVSLEELKSYTYLLNLFSCCDANNSGKVSHQELFDALTNMGDMFPNSFLEQATDHAHVSAKISAGDEDDDRLLSFAEFARIFIEF